jgi:hypothetical protein
MGLKQKSLVRESLLSIAAEIMIAHQGWESATD